MGSPDRVVATTAEHAINDVSKDGDTMTGALVLSDDGGGKLQFAPSVGADPDVEVRHAGAAARTLICHALTSGQFNLLWRATGGTPLVGLNRANGTVESPTQAVLGDILGSFYFFGDTEVVGSPAACGAIHVKALEDISSTAQGSEMEFFVKGAGETTFTGVMRLRKGEARVEGYIELLEVSTPAAPDDGKARLFIRDAGGGKSELCVRFASGAVQSIATEP